MAIKCPKCHSDNPETKRFCGECGTKLTWDVEPDASFTQTLETPVEDLPRGTLYAKRYEIIERLGAGGMGNVYKAYDKQLKEEVALKLIKPEIASDKETLDRFSNELKIARKIVHKNVGQMYELMEDEGAFFITMEYIQGQDLKGLIRQSRQLTSGTAITIAKQICEGLAEAHALGIVHRDMKSSNIMIDKQGNSRIMDFGIARFFRSKGVTGEGKVIGTPEYMSPEQVEGRDVDQRSDIYSLGVILYEMVTGKVPFEADTALGVAHKHRYEVPEEPKNVNVQIPDDLNFLIMRCLEKDRDKRYHSAGDVLSELETIDRGIPTTDRIIPKKTPITSREITVTFGLKKLFIPALIIVTLVVALLIIWQVLPREKAVPLRTDKPSLAVLYFENNTGDENLEHYRKAISDLLITDLIQSKHLRVLSGATLYNILKNLNLLEEKSYSSQDIKAVAIRGGVENIVLGNYTKAGDIFRLTVTLHKAQSEELIGSERVEGKGEQSIFAMVDELTRRIKGHFRLSKGQIASDIDKQVGMITTSSPEALKYFIEGDRYYIEGKFEESIQSLEKAVALDPNFAMAYKDIAMVSSYTGYPEKVKTNISKALALIDHVSDRERYLIQGDYYNMVENDYLKAIEIYQELLGVYPDDEEGNMMLGSIYRNLEEWDLALEQFERVLRINENYELGPQNLVFIHMGKGMLEEAMEILQKSQHTFSSQAYFHRLKARIFVCQGKFDQALREIEEALSLEPNNPRYTRSLGTIYHIKGDFETAEQIYKSLQENEDPAFRSDGLLCLSRLYLSQGKYEKSIDEIEKGIALTREFDLKYDMSDFLIFLGYLNLGLNRYAQAIETLDLAIQTAEEAGAKENEQIALHYRGIAQVRMNTIGEAEKTAEQLKQMIEKTGNRKSMRHYHHLMGMISLANGRIPDAEQEFLAAISGLSSHMYTFYYHSFFIEALASIYYKTQDTVSAQRECERIMSFPYGRIHFGDIYAKSFYMLGRINEENGLNSRAIQNYQKFLDLWEDADPGIAEVEDARKRLAGLMDN